MREVVRFIVPGAPVPKARPRFAKGHTYTPPQSLAYERKVGLCAREAGAHPTRSKLILTVNFRLPNARRVDLDNLVKSVLDGLNGVAWWDDYQVVELFAGKRIDPRNVGATVIVQEEE